MFFNRKKAKHVRLIYPGVKFSFRQTRIIICLGTRASFLNEEYCSLKLGEGDSLALEIDLDMKSLCSYRKLP